MKPSALITSADYAAATGRNRWSVWRAFLRLYEEDLRDGAPTDWIVFTPTKTSRRKSYRINLSRLKARHASVFEMNPINEQDREEIFSRIEELEKIVRKLSRSRCE